MAGFALLAVKVHVGWTRASAGVRRDHPNPEESFQERLLARQAAGRVEGAAARAILEAAALRRCVDLLRTTCPVQRWNESRYEADLKSIMRTGQGRLTKY